MVGFNVEFGMGFGMGFNVDFGLGSSCWLTYGSLVGGSTCWASGGSSVVIGGNGRAAVHGVIWGLADQPEHAIWQAAEEAEAMAASELLH